MPSSPHPDVTERRAKVIARISRGIPPGIVARELGVSADVVRQDLHRELARRKQELDEYRDLLIAQQVEELDQVRMMAWKHAMMRHYHVSQSGAITKDPDTGQPLLDTGPNDRALALVVKAQERLSKLLALDEAKKIEVKAEVVSVEAFRGTVEQLREAVARERAASGGGIAAGGVPGLTAGTGEPASRTIPGELPS
jgi:hypothetical protein